MKPDLNLVPINSDPIDTWEPTLAERPAPHVCFHGFFPGKCLAPACENYPKQDFPPLRLVRNTCRNCATQLSPMRIRHGRDYCCAVCKRALEAHDAR